VLLKSADRIERLASDYFLVDIGNAGGVNLIFQGKPLGILESRTGHPFAVARKATGEESTLKKFLPFVFDNKGPMI